MKTLLAVLLLLLVPMAGYGQAVFTNGGLVASSVNNTVSCLQTGANFGAKFATAVALLPSTGGIVDCSNLQGAQVISSDTFSGVTKPIKLIWPSGTVSASVSFNIPVSVAVNFHEAGVLSQAVATTATITGVFSGALTQHFIGSGNVTFARNGYHGDMYPQWWGAAGDGSHDDTLAIQRALDAAYNAQTSVFLPAGTYKTTSQLNMFAGSAGYENVTVKGAGIGLTVIRYFGPNTGSAIAIEGAFIKIADMSFENHNATGWVAGINYGSGAVRATQSKFENNSINCMGFPGDGIDLGLGGTQADLLVIDHPYINNCYSGSGVATFNGNVLSINLIAPSIFANHIGITVGITTNLNIFGGELDENDINLVGGCNEECIMDGVRSETSKRTFWSGAGTYNQPITFRNNSISSVQTARPVTTGTISPSSTSLTLSFTPTGTSTYGFVSGDRIVITGAGANGADMHTEITAMSSSTGATVIGAAGSGGTGASVTLDTTVVQNNISEYGGGPYTHIGNNWNPTGFGIGATAVSIANGPQVFIGNVWGENLSNPNGVIPTIANGGFIKLGNWVNFATSPIHMSDQVASNSFVSLPQNVTNPTITNLGNDFRTNNNMTTVYTDFVGGNYGQIIRVTALDNNSFIRNSSTIDISPGNSPATYGMPLEQTLEFIFVSGTWYPMGGTIMTKSPSIDAANLPICNAVLLGMMMAVANSMTQVWGANITSGGALPVLGYCDGTNWTVAGK